MISSNILEVIGHTPLIRLNRMVDEDSAEILVKFEGLNVGGSIKTRTAYNMIKYAEEEGLINKDTIIVEPTSGNQGIGLALIGAVLALAGILLMFTGCKIIKNISTPSFMLLTGGLCMILFAVFHWVIDVKGWVAWSYPLRVVGMNALVAYLMQTILPIRAIAKFFFGGLASLTSCPDFVMAVGYCGICWLILYFLHRNKVYVKV